ncbi:MAG: macro domain-containing protein [Myxococcota bacterium]
MKLYRGGKFGITVGDITKLKLDAIVNSTNPQLANGFGVDAAIHSAAGPELDAACAAIGGANFGEAKITPGFRLPAKHIIHVVAPIWRDGHYNEEDELDRIYDTALELGRQNGVKTIAFPAISTGTYAFPMELATSIALTSCVVYDQTYPNAYTRIVFCPFTNEDAEVYYRLAERFLA